jgi:hypothetical protein
MDLGTIAARLLGGYYDLPEGVDPTTFYIPGFGETGRQGVLGKECSARCLSFLKGSNMTS